MRSWLFDAVLVSALLVASPAWADITPPQMHTVAGGGNCSAAAPAALYGGSCDNVSATSATIDAPADVVAMPGGGFMYVDSGGPGIPPFGAEFVRLVSKSGKVTTVAGNGTNMDAPDGTPAIYSGLDGPVSAAPLTDGSILITEKDSSVIRVVSPGGQGAALISTIAGTGTPGFNGDGVGTWSRLNFPTDAEPQADGSVLIADAGNGLIRWLSAPVPGATMMTIAGGGWCNDATTFCDGLPASAVKLNDPVSVSPIAGGAGGYLIAEGYNSITPGGNAIREVTPSGLFVTVAGVPGAGRGYSGDGGLAIGAQLSNPERVLSTSDGGFLIADTDNSRLRKVSPTGIITTIAGNGVPSYAGDNGAATDASLNGPVAMSPLANGNMLIADISDPAIREITLAPTTTISLTPSTPNGTNGWFIGTVHAKVSGGSGSTTNCDLDLAVAPTVMGQLDSPCAYTGTGGDITGNGVHLLWVASMNSFGDQETPFPFFIDIDSNPPTMRCLAKQTFLAGSRGKRVKAKVIDGVSGPRKAIVSAGANTSSVGRHTATLVGANNAGITSLVRCHYTVVTEALRPTPTLSSSFSPGGATTSVRQLLVKDVPAHAQVNLTCSGAGCPFRSAGDVTGAKCSGKPCTATARDKRRVRHWVDLIALFSGARLGSGAKLTVVVTKTGAVGRAWVFTFPAGGQPSRQDDCLKPGSSVPGKC